MTRSAPVPSPILTDGDERVPGEEARPVAINRAAVESANAYAVVSDDAMDINGDGQRDALSDGIVILRICSASAGQRLSRASIFRRASGIRPPRWKSIWTHWT